MANRADLVKPLHDEILIRILLKHPNFKLEDNDGFIQYKSNKDEFVFLRNALRCNTLFIKDIMDKWVKNKIKYDTFVLNRISDILLKYDIRKITFNYAKRSFDKYQRVDWRFNDITKLWEVERQY